MADLQPVSSAISGGFGLIGSALNYHFQKKLMAKQNKYNIDMWNLENEYNSPSAQMRRYEEAGLNPALMYGQVTPGNATGAPVQGTPEAPNLSRDMRELGEAFNVEGIKQAIADTKYKQAMAKNAQTDAERNELELMAEKFFGHKYTYDYATGRYVVRPEDAPGTVSVIHPSAYYFNRILEGNYNKTALFDRRSNLMESQKRLNNIRYNILAPQVGMRLYDAKNYKTSYWIGQGGKVLGTFSKFLP